MLRILFVGMLFVVVEISSAVGQDYRWREENGASETSQISVSNNLLRHIRYQPVEPKPVAGNPFASETRVFLFRDDEDLGIPGDTLSEQQILRRMSRIYGYQAQLLEAQARSDREAVESLLDISMKALAVLVDQPDLMDRSQFRELYRTVLVEYEQYYGFSDSLALQQGDIYLARDEAFQTIDEADRAPLEGIQLPELEFADTEFPMDINERVQRSIVYLLTDPDKHINHWLSRAETYFPMIERIFAEEGIPDELKYLAMIESGLNPRARSWARAVGMWQFVNATGRAYDLNTNGWVDERMNPEKSTRAAAQHLRDLYRMFGDWQLALAGYNYSPGKLRHHIRRAEVSLGRKATYWDVYSRLPRETRNYVPMFIATAIVASKPEEFGLGQEVEPGPAYEFDYVPVRGMLELDEVASMAGTDVETIRALNPELRSSHLPPTQSDYYVRIPLNTYDRFAGQYRNLPAAKKAATSHHRVQSGETLGQIASRYGVSVSALMRKNGLHSTMIRVGQNLIVPVANYSGGIEITDARPMRVQYGMRYIRPIAPAVTSMLDSSLLIARAEEQRAEQMPVVRVSQPVEQATDSSDNTTQEEESPEDARIVYRVRQGDTLSKIARQFRVTVNELRQWNNIRSSMIRVGQQLMVYTKPSS